MSMILNIEGEKIEVGKVKIKEIDGEQETLYLSVPVRHYKTLMNKAITLYSLTHEGMKRVNHVIRDRYGLHKVYTNSNHMSILAPYENLWIREEESHENDRD